MMKFLSGVVLTVALCGLYATAQQVTTKLPSTTVKLNGSGGGGSGDVESVTLTGTAPVTVTGSPCASGACAFTLGLGTVPATNGGTGLTTFTLGDLLYSSATNTLAKLAGNTTTTRKLLSQTGDGAASAAPSWVPIYDIPCNTETEDCTFQAPANFSLFINSDLMTLTSSSTILTDAAENPILQVSASGTSTLVKDRLEGDAILQRDKNQLATTGTLQGAYAECATSGGAVVGTLDADTATVGRVLTVTRVGANTCTVAVESGHTLDGVTDGTTTVPSAGWKTFVQTGDTAWVTAGSYPVTGTLSGLTAGKLPVATSATAVGDSAITHNSTTGVTTFGGSGPKLVIGSQAIDETAAAAGLDLEFTSFVNFVTGGSPVAYFTSSGTLVLTGSGSVNGNIHLTSAGGTIGWNGFESNLRDDGPGQVGVYGAGSTYGQLNVGTIQQSYSKALVDATATDVVQVPVAKNSYEGFTMDYTIFATDATDYQVRQGSVPVAVLNVGGTETCVFGTATEAVNASAGTLTVAFDCTAGTNTVMVRANANTSLASTTVFTIQQRINLTSGTAVLVPQ